MSAAACQVFFNEKSAQTEKVYRERFAATVGVAPIGAADWAKEYEPDLHAGYKAAQEQAEALWLQGECSETFKKHVLNHLRGFLEICRRYDTFLRQQEAA